jgi:hypothetical protein
VPKDGSCAFALGKDEKAMTTHVTARIISATAAASRKCEQSGSLRKICTHRSERTRRKKKEEENFSNLLSEYDNLVLEGAKYIFAIQCNYFLK